jgi:NAD(P)-dependent dehydrogenase (short-subunit alcohol dehydrogenase family)
MKNKTAIVTAGAQGIGRACVKALLDAGYDVAVLDNDKLALAGMTGRGLLPVACDVGRESQIRKAVSVVSRSFGRIDCLINNAGIGVFKPLEELTLAQWNRVLAVNLTSIFLMVKHLKPLFRNNKGAIVNIASTRALMSERNTESYSASKGGVAALTHSLAVSLGPDIRVNCVSPGWINTSLHQKKGAVKPLVMSGSDHAQHPCGRVGVPEDIAEMVLYLLSDKAGFITGQNFVVDGGMTKKMIYV